MAVTYYRYDDASAPTLTGEVGSIINVLDKCLVTGYGAKGAAGWTKPYTGTNKAVFRMSSTGGGNGHYLRVLDDGSSSDGAARTANLLGYTAMTTVDAGTGQFPPTANLDVLHTAGMRLTKSNTLDTVQRPWLLIADDTYFYFYCYQTNTAFVSNNGARQTTCFFGQFDSRKAGDTTNTVIGCRNASSYTDAGAHDEASRQNVATSFSFAPTTHRFFIAKDFLSLRTGAPCVLANAGVASNLNNATGIMAFPNSITGNIDYSEVRIREKDPFSSTYSQERGTLPYLKTFEGQIGDLLSDTWPFLRAFQVLTGTGVDAGKTFLVIYQLQNGSSYPQLLQISGNR